MHSELVGLYNIVDKVLEKRRAGKAARLRDKVVIAIYKLGGNGQRAVEVQQLAEGSGLSKGEILQAVGMADGEGWIMDCSSHDGMAWALKPAGLLYAEGLLEEGRGGGLLRDSPP